MTRTLSALAFTALLSTSAQAGPVLKAEALVSGDLVTVGDLFDGAEGLEGIALFRAPDLGQTGPLPASAALAAARRAGVPGCEAGEVREVFVTRASREVSDVEITGAITARAATDYGADVDEVEVRLDRAGAPLHLDTALNAPLAVTRFVADPKSGRFEATLDVAGRSRGTAPIHVTGAAVQTIEVATLARPLARGEIVSASDVRTERKPRAQAQDAVAPADAAGMAAKRALREGQPLRSGDLMRPQHVDRGAFVTLIFTTSGVSLSLRAKALATGAQGDVVAVQNLQSKRVVNGVVTGPSEVTVMSGATTVARR